MLQKSHGASDEKKAKRAAQRRDASAAGDLAEKQKKAKHRSASPWQTIDYVPGTRMVAALFAAGLQPDVPPGESP